MRPLHHDWGKMPVLMILLNSLISPSGRMSVLDFIILLLLLSEYTAFLSFNFNAVLRISYSVISVSSVLYSSLDFSLSFRFLIISSWS